MRSTLFILFLCLVVTPTMAQKIETPDELYGDLFVDVQMSHIFPDSKTFVDCIPKRDPKAIVTDYKKIKNNPAIRFSLKLFVEENFIVPQVPQTDFVTKGKDIVQHINNLWVALRRRSDTLKNRGSLLPLPKEYIIPGGRFREIYYWDSYFTLLGLRESKQYDLIEHMIQNFAYLINTYGHMPNGNRTYYLSRSQPPFFSLMVDLLAGIKGKNVYATYLPALEKEYAYWMDKTAPTQHVVKMPDGSVLNRYWDQLSKPRQESYAEDVTVAKTVAEKDRAALYKNFRSGAESGWDFSSRWMKDGKNLNTLQTTNLIPVDLNCLLYHLEQTLANTYQQKENKIKAAQLQKAAQHRKEAINHYCWSKEQGFYVDYAIAEKKQSPHLTLAGMFPFFMQLANASHMDVAKKIITEKFLQSGGVVTTLITTGQQWDAPNGWAPLQWITVVGLENYHQAELAKIIASRWIFLNKRVFDVTGKLLEKYDVVDANKPGGGGEYPSQDGFGWTNGVLLALISKYQ
ncbi:MAG: alpha,alpha-trehalase [Chitinophagaceae bacterium]